MRQLLHDGHEVTVIDTRADALARATANYEALPVAGSCLEKDILLEANVEKTELLIVSTGSEETNLLCCMLARKLNPSIRTIPRIRSSEFLALMDNLRSELGVSMANTPDVNAANEIFSLVRFSGVVQRDTFAKGRVEIVELRVDKGSKLEGTLISTLPKKTGCKVLVCAVMRNGKAFIPKGDDTLLAGDEVYVTAPSTVLTHMLEKLGLSKKIKRVMIIGGDRICYHLAKKLIESGTSVKIIENDPVRAETLSEKLPQAVVITGDGASQDTLDREGCENMDALITLTGLDEVNMIVSMYGAQLGVSTVITKINRIESPVLLSGLKIGSIISSTNISGRIIAQYARAMEAKSGSALTVHSIANDQVEAMEFKIDKDSEYLHTPLKDMPIKKGILLSCITRGSSTPIIPDGNSEYRIGDTVIIVVSGNLEIENFNDIFQS